MSESMMVLVVEDPDFEALQSAFERDSRVVKTNPSTGAVGNELLYYSSCGGGGFKAPSKRREERRARLYGYAWDVDSKRSTSTPSHPQLNEDVMVAKTTPSSRSYSAAEMAMLRSCGGGFKAKKKPQLPGYNWEL